MSSFERIAIKMFLSSRIRYCLILVCLGILLLAMTYWGYASGISSKSVLWAWERPEELGFLNAHAKVAYLAETIYLRGDSLVVRPRRQALHLPPEAQLTTVIRLETSQADPPTFSVRQTQQLVNQMDAMAKKHPGQGIQIDFDARLTERAFYRRLLIKLHEKLPPSTRLSMTALASWCIGDTWIHGLPVSEAIPMLFRMGADTDTVLNYLASGQDFKEPLCRQSMGLAVDEQTQAQRLKSAASHRFFTDRTIYWFNPQPWTETSWKQVKEAFSDAG